MPSNGRVRDAVATFAGTIRAFDSSVGRTADEVRAYAAPRQSTWDAQVARLAAELGPLAAGRVDPQRFAAVFGSRHQVDASALRAVEGALEVLGRIAARGDALSVTAVPPGGSLYDTVARALGEVGRAFSAARLVHAIRAGAADAAGAAIEALPFAQWTRNERRVAPPLVVSVSGADLRAAALAEFLDGRQKIVLVVDGECPPAPLVRLVAPGTFVIQTAEAAGLAGLAAWDGAGIGALVPECAARFVHDPGAAGVVVDFVPETVPRRTIAGLSPAQQTGELALLRALVAKPAQPAAGGGGAAAAGTAPAEGGAPVDRLAAWLLSQVDLAELG